MAIKWYKRMATKWGNYSMLNQAATIKNRASNAAIKTVITQKYLTALVIRAEFVIHTVLQLKG